MPTTEDKTDEAERDRELCPLSFAQERLWFLDQLQPRSPAYNISQAWRLEGEFNSKAFERAINEVVRRHESLRTTFSRVEGKPVVVISAHHLFTLALTDLTAERDPEGELARQLNAAARTPFNLQQGPLLRLNLFKTSSRRHVALFTLHHIISDAWTFEILRREVTALYAAFEQGRNLQLPELPIQYLDYAHWQREQISGERLQSEIRFWQQQLAGELPRLELPHDKPLPALASDDGASEAFHLGAELSHQLRKLAQRENATLFTVLLAAFNTLLHRVTGQDDFIVGTPVSGREVSETEGLVGILVNTVPLRTRIRGNPSFVELLREVRDTAFAIFAHHDIPFEELVKAVQPDRVKGQNPLFQVVVAFHEGYPAEWTLGKLRATTLDVETHTAKFDLTFLLEEAGDGIKGRLEYKTDLFEAVSIQRFLQQFQLLLKGIASNPGQRLSEYALMGAGERHLVLNEWNNTASNYERDQCIHELFELQAARTPDAVALEFGPRRLTYRGLNERANRLASRLRRRGVKANSLVGLGLERSPEMIIATLAILKAGGAYVPLDRSYPEQRIAFMIREASLTLVIGDSRFQELLHRARRSEAAEPLSELVCLDIAEETPDEPAANLPSETTPEDLAYVMFTSGSTGRPKGTAIPHRAVVRLVRNTNYATFSPADVFLQLAPTSFDASTFEIWGALLNGARLVLYPPQTPSLEELGRAIESAGITTLWLTAGLFHQMVDYQLPRLKSVRQLLAGGDVLSVPHVLKVLRELPECQLINGYGPTENTTFTCCHRIPADWPCGRSVPIGKPISNTRVYVLDTHLQPVPIGVPGELFAAGDGLAQGYLGQPELTAERFVSWHKHPTFNIQHSTSNPQAVPMPSGLGVGRSELNVECSAASPERLYRTGDLVRWLPDGTLEFLGRKDQQVKIRGFRIEPAEIEAVLMLQSGVKQAAVIALSTGEQDRQLFACITMADQTAFDEPSLRNALAETLPAYMIPSRIVCLDALPLTPNGKLDVRALASLDSETASAAALPPRNLTEESLHQIWQQVLGRNSFGVHDNFFHLGGHSLLVTQMISRISRVFSIDLPVRAVFEAPTVAGLAEKLNSTAANTSASAGGIVPRRSRRNEARQLLTRIDNLSDAEVESLLSRSP